jgi:hypothetical protein
MIGASSLSMDVIPDEEDDLTMAAPDNKRISEETVSC